MAEASKREEILALGVPAPEAQRVLLRDDHGPSPPLSGAPHAIQQSFRECILSLVPPTYPNFPKLLEHTIRIRGRDGHDIPVLVHRQNHRFASRTPLIILFHGGGFAFGQVEMLTPIARSLVQRFGFVCLNVDYRLATDYPFPAAVNDAWDVTRWAAANAAAAFHVDLKSGFIVGGHSAGGNLADVVGHLARDEGLAMPLTGLLEITPIYLLHPRTVPEDVIGRYLSWEQCKNAEEPARQWNEFTEALYKGDIHSPTFIPFNHPKGHSDLPPIFLQACGWDPFRDDALIYHSALEKAGVMSELKVYPGMPHGFFMHHPELEASKKFHEELFEGVAWLLRGGKTGLKVI